MKLKITSAAWHRNGVCGEGFYAILFRNEEEGLDMVASLFDKSGYCAVYDVALLASGSVVFGENSWREDRYEHTLRPLLETWLSEHGSNRLGPFSAIPASAVEEAIQKELAED